MRRFVSRANRIAPLLGTPAQTVLLFERHHDQQPVLEKSEILTLLVLFYVSAFLCFYVFVFLCFDVSAFLRICLGSYSHSYPGTAPIRTHAHTQL